MIEHYLSEAVGFMFDHTPTFVNWGMVGGAACIALGVAALGIVVYLDASEAE